MADGRRLEIEPETPEQLAVFTDAFARFNQTIAKLRQSYNDLQKRYQKLDDELTTANEKLRATLSEHVRMRSFLQNILESLTSGVITIDLNGKITSVNQAACTILKVDQDRLIGYDYRKLFGGGFSHNSSLCSLLEGGKTYTSIEKNISLSETLTVPISASSSLIRDHNGEALGAVEVFVDLTEMKHLEEETARVKSLAALGEVAAVVAHEVRNPLSGIGGFAMMLAQELGRDHPRIGYVDRIIEGVEKLDYCVSSLLTYSKDLVLDLKPDDLAEVLRETGDLFAMELSARESKSRLRVRVPRETVRCLFERENLSGAIMNLLKNAEQAMPDGGTVELGLRVTDDEAMITVSDTGSGIPEDSREKIFDPFFTTREGGTGLGLALVGKIVAAHKGIIDLESEEAVGSTFTLTLSRRIRT